MKAAVLRETGRPFSIEDIEIDPPKENEVLVRVVASGICHSDYSVMHGVLRSPMPVVLGHEGAGIVEEVGPGVSHVKAGDPIVASLTPSCGTCPMCLEEKPYLCFQFSRALRDSAMPDGSTRLHRGEERIHQLGALGSFAEYMVIPAGCAIKVRADAALDTVCLIGCGVTTGVGAALNTVDIEPGQSVAVIGCGGVGLSIIQGARIAKANPIVAIDPVAEKRDLAKSMGATHAIDPSNEDVVKVIRGLTGQGVHYAFEALGRPETIQQAYSIVRPRGQAIIVGVPNLRQPIELPFVNLLAEKEIRGSAYGSSTPKRDIPKYVDLYKSGELMLDQMITRRIGLDEINEAFAAMGRGEGARTVITFS
jgi:S-(hydroxymethyl)glutathione dehydrogenase/alcohol dehydrogenase